MISTNQIYIRGIDHLRGLAALMVLFYHAIHSGDLVPQAYVPQFPVLSLLEEGHTGVALFITITGFIFTFIIGENQISYPRFLFNRFLRIFPLLFVVSLFAAFVVDGVKAADPLALVKFFNLFGGGVYWGTWTLVVEFQFYLFFPVFYLYFRDTWRGPLQKYLPYIGLIMLAFAFRVIFYTQADNAQDIGYWTIFGRIDQFMMGAMACLLLKDLERGGWLRSHYSGLGIFLVSLALLVLVYHYLNTQLMFVTAPPSPSTGWLVVPALEGLLYGGILLGWVVFSKNFTGRISAFFAYIGAISYSTYLLQFGVLLFSLQLSNRFGWQFSEDVFINKLLLAVLLVYPLTLVLGMLSYELIEKPFFRKRMNYIIR
jgi:peptidoglycan/LPS O-acetylase OafA/YrhL